MEKITLTPDVIDTVNYHLLCGLIEVLHHAGHLPSDNVIAIAKIAIQNCNLTKAHDPKSAEAAIQFISHWVESFNYKNPPELNPYEEIH